MITVTRRTIQLTILSMALGGGLYTQSSHAADPQLAAICSLIDYNHAQKDIAGAAYVAGVDVHGKSVAPAGLNEQISEQGKAVTPQNFSFVLSLDLAERYMNLPEGLELKSEGVPLEITPDGQISVGDAERTQELRALCKDHYGQAIAP